jgi:hypothetical protein
MNRLRDESVQQTAKAHSAVVRARRVDTGDRLIGDEDTQ